MNTWLVAVTGHPWCRARCARRRTWKLWLLGPFNVLLVVFLREYRIFFSKSQFFNLKRKKIFSSSSYFRKSKKIFYIHVSRFLVTHVSYYEYRSWRCPSSRVTGSMVQFVLVYKSFFWVHHIPWPRYWLVIQLLLYPFYHWRGSSIKIFFHWGFWLGFRQKSFCVCSARFQDSKN